MEARPGLVTHQKFSLLVISALALPSLSPPSRVTPLLVWSHLLQYTRAARKHLDPAAKGNICAQVFWPGLRVGGGVDL